MNSLLAFYLGAVLSASLRCVVGAVFHYLPGIEKWHEAHHDRLRRSWINQANMLTWQDTALEVFYFLALVVPGWLFLSRKVFGGMCFELLLSFVVREAIFHASKASCLRKAQIYYWYHVFVDSQAHWGFSMPFADWLIGRHMPTQSWPFPFPFVDFFRSDNDDDYFKAAQPILLEAIEAYKDNPALFMERQMQRIEARKATCTVCRVSKRLRCKRVLAKSS